MVHRMPQVRQFMTPAPQTIDRGASLKEVQRCMRKYGVRHLPVRSENKIVGVISDRSTKTALGIRLSETFTAEDIMITDPFSVSPEEDLDIVVGKMAEDKFGCALIQEDGEVVGIFTTTDACRALRQLLETVYVD